MSDSGGAPAGGGATGGGAGPGRWLVVGGAALVAALAVVAVVLVADDGTDTGAPPRPARTTTGTGASTPSPAGTPPGGEDTTPGAEGTATPTARPTSPGAAFGYPMLYPFADEAEARAWQRRYRSGGHQPWHLDPCVTASSFTTAYLGFGSVDRTLSCRREGAEAFVTVGYPGEGTSRSLPAAVVHLVRVGGADDAPWEVVGTRDERLTLTRPAYGATVSSPVRVGGRITGVDESIHVQVRQLSSASPVGDHCCTAAGGRNSPWGATVALDGATDPVATVVAWTGGHLSDVETFAVTAVRPH